MRRKLFCLFIDFTHLYSNFHLIFLEPNGKPDRSISMQQHLYQAQIRLRRYKRRVRPPYVGGEAAQLLADGRHGRQV